MVRSYESRFNKGSNSSNPVQVSRSETSGTMSGAVRVQSALSDANNNPDDDLEVGTTSEVTNVNANRTPSQVASTNSGTTGLGTPILGHTRNSPPTTLLDNIDLEFSSSSGNFSITLHQVIGRFDQALCFICLRHVSLSFLNQ